jgi:hypothetical protein
MNIKDDDTVAAVALVAETSAEDADGVIQEELTAGEPTSEARLEQPQAEDAEESDE